MHIINYHAFIHPWRVSVETVSLLAAASKVMNDKQHLNSLLNPLFSVQMWPRRQSRQCAETYNNQALIAGRPVWEPWAFPSILTHTGMLQYHPLCASECSVWFLNEWHCLKNWLRVVFVTVRIVHALFECNTNVHCGCSHL